MRHEVLTLKSQVRAMGSTRRDPSANESDIAQEVVLRWLRLNPAPSFDDAKALRAYLWTAANRLLVARLRRPSSRAVRFDASESKSIAESLKTSGGLRELEQRDRGAALEFALQLLDPDDLQILRWCYFEQLAPAEIAEKLGIARAAANSRLVRARAKLAHKLRNWADTIG